MQPLTVLSAAFIKEHVLVSGLLTNTIKMTFLTSDSGKRTHALAHK